MQQLRSEIVGYFGAASAFDERVAAKFKLSRTDMRCLELIGRLGPLTAGRLAEESGLTLIGFRHTSHLPRAAPVPLQTARAASPAAGDE